MTEGRPGVILVTGGAGFIGCALSKALAPSADRYIVLDNLHPQVHPQSVRPEALHPSAELVVADATDPSVWDEVLKSIEPDLVVHLAAETGTGQSLSESTRHATVNVVGTTQMIDAFHRHQKLPKHLVLTSSRAVYGEGRWIRDDGTILYPGQRSHAQLERGEWDFPNCRPLPSSVETTFPHPTSVYGATKLAQENLLAAWCGAHSVPLTVLRLQNVYGPGQSPTNAYTGIVVLFAQMARDLKPIPLYEDGGVTRDFVHVDDVTDALVRSVERVSKGSKWLDVGSGTPITISVLAETLREAYGGPEPVITGQFRDGDVRHAQCSIESAMTTLQWTPRRALADGLQSLRKWIELA